MRQKDETGHQLSAAKRAYKSAAEVGEPTGEGAAGQPDWRHTEEPRKIQLLIDKLKQSENRELEAEDMAVDCCSETETEVDDLSLDDRNLAKLRTAGVAVPNACTKHPESSTQSTSRSSGSLTIGRKRIRVILSDDEGEGYKVYCSSKTAHKCPAESVATSDEYKTRKCSSSRFHEFQDVSPAGARCSASACTPVNLEVSNCSYKSRNSRFGVMDGKYFRSTNTDAVVDESSSGTNEDNCTDGYGNLFENRNYATKSHSFGDEPYQHITCKIDEDLVHMKLDSCRNSGKLNIEDMKVEVACLYCLQLSKEKRSRGLVPVIQHMKYGWIDVFVGVMVPNNIMKLYIDCCEALPEPANLKVLKKLYNLRGIRG
ncbi:unnamed protein product [Fraxinus pennsylvanica]|uniref:Uncharacterized protein n=1 Tax=Fraxinus pennsylvanica TaxID=56036 RepID=A0AAD1YVN8_9LAMI|nr:unnamed protein product [Fraxinus pennsylvanica]